MTIFLKSVQILLILGAGVLLLASSSGQGPASQERPSGGDEPGKTVLDNLKQNRESDFQTIAELKTEILVVEGSKTYDHVQEVLDGLNVKYDQVSLAEFPKKDLKSYVAVLINCYGEPVPEKAGAFAPARTISADVRDKTRKYVESGGYLYTSDWTIALAAASFPEFLTQGNHIAKQNETFSVRPFPANENHPLLRDVFTLGAKGGHTDVQKKAKKAEWTIETMSLTFDIAAAGKAKVQTLVVSDALQSKYGSSLIGVAFNVGPGSGGPVTGENKIKGRSGLVFHVIGHFYQQGLGNQDNAEVAKMYQMIANFIIEAKKAHTSVGKK